MAQQQDAYPVQFSVDYPDRSLNRLTTFFRIITVIPIAIILLLVASGGGDAEEFAAGLGGTIVLATCLMILFRRKYPRWWFDFNVALLKFWNRVEAYLLLLRDEYPSTDEEQAVHLDITYPDAERDLNRWLPLIKWLLAIPHYIVLSLLCIIAFFIVIIAWFAIMFTGRFPRDLHGFVVGTIRWQLRVNAYAIILTTDRYPPFRLGP